MTAAFDYRGARDAVFGSGLPGALKLLLLALVEYMPHCSPSVAALARDCGVERKTVLRALQRLERASVLAVERRSGARSVYALRPPSDWRFQPEPVPSEGTGPEAVPVPTSGTGTNGGPVPERDGTGPNGGMGPVPNRPRTGPILVPKAGRSRSESGRAEARAPDLVPFEAPTRTLSMPSTEPTESYLGSCVMGGVSPKQARSTWSHYVGQGLPQGGVERLEWWLVQRAKEKQEELAGKAARARASPQRPGDELQTTEAATAWRPNSEAAAFTRDWLSRETLAEHAAQCRAVPRFAGLGTVQQDAEFLARLRYLKATGTFLPDGPLKRPPPKGVSA